MTGWMTNLTTAHLAVRNCFIYPDTACRKRKKERGRKTEKKKRRAEKGRRVIVKVSVVKIPVRVIGKHDALSKHRPVSTYALSNAYRTAVCGIFPGIRMGDRRFRFIHTCEPRLSRHKFKNARKRSLYFTNLYRN